MEEMSNWLIKQEELKLDENKRVDKKKDSHSMQGSFRKLALDWHLHPKSAKNNYSLMGIRHTQNMILFF